MERRINFLADWAPLQVNSICEITEVSLKGAVPDALLCKYMPGPHPVLQLAHAQ